MRVQHRLVVVTIAILASMTRLLAGDTKAPDGRELDQLWADLADVDAARAYRAMCRLTAHPDVGVPFLRANLRPVRPLDARTVTRLVALLDSENFEDREKAQKELDGFGAPVRAYLQRALDASASPEARRCIEGVLRQIDEEQLSSESLRCVRAVEALERIGNADARRLVKEICAGAPGARLTQEAESSLSRMTARP